MKKKIIKKSQGIPGEILSFQLVSPRLLIVGMDQGSELQLLGNSFYPGAERAAWAAAGISELCCAS